MLGCFTVQFVLRLSSLSRDSFDWCNEKLTYSCHTIYGHIHTHIHMHLSRHIELLEMCACVYECGFRYEANAGSVSVNV